MEEFDNDKEKLTKYILENGGYDSFVLKPQREGGANNFFGEDIRLKINEFSKEELHLHILMKRIHPT